MGCAGGAGKKLLAAMPPQWRIWIQEPRGGPRKSPSARLGGSTESGVSTPPEAKKALGEGA